VNHDTTYADLLTRSLIRHAAAPAVVLDDGATLSHATMHERALTIADAMTGIGLRPGDRVGIWLENSVPYLEVEWAVLLTGLVRVGVNHRLHPAEAAAILRRSGAALLVCSVELAETLEPYRAQLTGLQTVVVDGAPGGRHVPYREFCLSGQPNEPGYVPAVDDTAVLMFSSGTTGEPKGAALSQRAWAATTRNMLIELPPIGPGDVLLQVAPMGHFAGCVAQAYTVRGAAVALRRRFDSTAVLDDVARLRVSAIPLVPTMLQRLTAEAERREVDLSSLRVVPYGGAPITPAWLRRAVSVFGDVLVQMYGLSEVIAPVTALSPTDHRPAGSDDDKRLGSAGRVTPFTALRIVDEAGRDASPGVPGELLVRGETVMSGYWNDPEGTSKVLAPDGWLKTGDIGAADADGFVTLVDRRSDLIVSGGFNILPGEVERVIAELPGVADVAVIGVPHPDLGEAVAAVVVAEPGCRIDLDTVQEQCRRALASYKKPLTLDIVEALPRNASGKVQRRAIRAPYWRGHDRFGAS
jgi:long-chain acyl-CoA synthetase